MRKELLTYEPKKSREQWRPALGYGWNYMISDQGRILSLFSKDPTIMQPTERTDGYIQVTLLNKNWKRRPKSVHRLVYEAFKGKIPKDKQVDHINNNRKDNRLSNLQLLTPEENVRKAFSK